ncbi:IS110 family transposase [Paraburkholderia sp. BL9I2N2]|uniref:IS110 family transposase n=1 Tax=Paraburkholderia sp. BL9I2N2 TaxID=1938809 RepID=UPI0010EBD0AD|nr:IS110 family transposase [Paraburkholderia sp. BL9I2N2]TCK84366.1 transposase [Paraburkholderia sp. BL9I2N2]
MSVLSCEWGWRCARYNGYTHGTKQSDSGFDTHLDTHVGAVITDTGRLLATLSVSTDTAGYFKLLTWANSFGQLQRAGVEGSGTYGTGLARVLRDREIEVLEVNRPDRAMRRSKGKSDPTDAENTARAVLSGRATAIPKEQSGAAEAMRAVSVARRSAVKARTQAINQLRALLVSAPQEIRERLLKAKTTECVEGCARLRSLGKTPMLQTLTTTVASVKFPKRKQPVASGQVLRQIRAR